MKPQYDKESTPDFSPQHDCLLSAILHILHISCRDIQSKSNRNFGIPPAVKFFDSRIASEASGGGKIELRLGSSRGALIGICNAQRGFMTRFQVCG